MSSITKLIKNPYKGIYLLKKIGIDRCIPDKLYLQILFRADVGRKLNLDNPQTFNEKLQWLKLYDRKPIYTTMVDKYEAKKYVADIIGEEYIIPTLGVWEKFEDIDFDVLPNQFVLKCTHDSGGLVICRDKSKFDIEAARKKMNKSLKRNFYYSFREWPYKNIKPRIIAEKYMVDESGYDLKDYKFFCFNGVPKIMFIESERAKGREGHTVDFFTENFEHIDLTVDGYPNSKNIFSKPENFEQMKFFASVLSQNIAQLRVDFYNINNHIYFGELTFYHGSGMAHFEPLIWNKFLGDMITLPFIDNDHFLGDL